MFKDIKDQLGGFILLGILGLLMMALIFMDLRFSSDRDQTEGQQQVEEGASDHTQEEQGSEGSDDKPSQHGGNSGGDISESNGDQHNENESDNTGNNTDETPVVGEQYKLQLHQVEGEFWVQLDELAMETNGNYEWDEINGVVTMELFNIPFILINGVPVVERNGLYLPHKMKPLFGEEDVYLPLDFLTYGLDIELEVEREIQQVSFIVGPEVEDVFAELSTKPVQLEELTVDEIINYLSFLTSPIPEASISTRTSHLPGARRAYRNGYHEGIDWYSGTTGRRIDLNTPVISMADGIVVRSDYDYVEMDREERQGYLSLSNELNDTPTFILDKLRGRSVWVQYDQGVTVRYVHLSKVGEGITVGTEVKRGDTLGYVGNSGTSFAIDGDEQGGLHLHMDLLIYGELFWQYIDQPSEVRRILESVF
jgi:murein DD-endopeptidase MepM/ murein hydrolase activator NlpD